MKIGFTCSPFDLLHAGHIEMLRECKKHCDYLICGINTAPIKRGKKPVQSLMERHIQLSGVKYVDEIIPYDTEQSLIDLLETTEIHLRFVGEDYVDRSFTGKGLHEIYYTNSQHSFSSSGLRQKVSQS